MQALLALSGEWKQGRCGLATPCCFTRGRQIVEDIAVLLRERSHYRHYRFDEPGPLRIWVPKLPLRHNAPGRMARAAALFVGSTPS